MRLLIQETSEAREARERSSARSFLVLSGAGGSLLRVSRRMTLRGASDARWKEKESTRREENVSAPVVERNMHAKREKDRERVRVGPCLPQKPLSTTY